MNYTLNLGMLNLAPEMQFLQLNNFTELVSCNGNFFPCLGPELGVGLGMCGGHP